MKKITALLLVICMLLLSSCSMVKSDGGGFHGGYGAAPEMGAEDFSDATDTDDGAPDEGGQKVTLPAGMITAAAWNDNKYYNDWLALFAQGEEANAKFYQYTLTNHSWGYNSLNRVEAIVTNADGAVAGAEVVAYDEQGNVSFSAVTDAQGRAYLFPQAKSGNITVKNGDETVSASFSEDNRCVELQLSEAENKLNVIEIMFVVDVTGSMGDELEFLKAEVADVINRIAANDSETVIKLAMLFYRDTDDDVPFDYYDFTTVTTPSGLAAQQEALDKQRASGGGDYPEAVDDALSIAVGKQWSTGATTKIIFHVLDAPAHDNVANKQKLAAATEKAAELGIRICPIICSGSDIEVEYTMREVAIYTGGTFIFVTDDSGIGNSHHDPDLPNATVELLNSLMVRLVKGYHTGEFEEPVYWKQDPNLASDNR